VGSILVPTPHSLDVLRDQTSAFKAAALDLAHCAGSDSDPCQPKPVLHVVGNDSVRLLVRIRHAECPARSQRTLPAGCGCDETEHADQTEGRMRHFGDCLKN
jgi:hypothetical protein